MLIFSTTHDHSLLWQLVLPVEHVIGGVRLERLGAKIARRVAAGRGCQSTDRVYPLNERGSEQRGASSWSYFSADDLEQHPGNRVRVDDGLRVRLCPHGTRVLRISPRGANGSANFMGIRTEEVTGELAAIVVEQRGLRSEQGPDHLPERFARRAHIVL